MEALRAADAKQLSSLSKRINVMQARLDVAKEKQAKVAEETARGATAPSLADTAKSLVELGRSYTARGMHIEALQAWHATVTPLARRLQPADTPPPPVARGGDTEKDMKM